MDMVPGVEISEKHSGSPKGALKNYEVKFVPGVDKIKVNHYA